MTEYKKLTWYLEFDTVENFTPEEWEKIYNTVSMAVCDCKTKGVIEIKESEDE